MERLLNYFYFIRRYIFYLYRVHTKYKVMEININLLWAISTGFGRKLPPLFSFYISGLVSSYVADLLTCFCCVRRFVTISYDDITP